MARIFAWWIFKIYYTIVSKLLYTKWLIAENNAHIFNYDINKDLAKLGGIQQANKKTFVL